MGGKDWKDVEAREVTDLFFRATSSEPELGLRPYQMEARKAVAESWVEGRTALVVMPTGTGKSRLAGAICWDVKSRGKKTLVLCPTIILCQQMYEDLRALGLHVSIEQAENRADRWGDVVVASVATLKGRRLASYHRGHFGAVIADECHRSVSKMYRSIFSHFDAHRVGLTATPMRSDGVGLCSVFDRVAFQMNLLDAIRDGWLVQLDVRTVHTQWDVKQIKEVAGDVDPESVAAELVRSGVMLEAAVTLADLVKTSRAVAFMPTVKSSIAFMAELKSKGVEAGHIDANTSPVERQRLFKSFAAGEIRVLCNVACLTEGWNCPEADVVALMSPTKSVGRLMQMIGRVTRLASGKTRATVLDFCPGRMRKGRLAAPADALAGRMLDDDTIGAVGDGNLVDQLAKAENTAEELKELRARKEQRDAERRERSERLKRLAKWRSANYAVERHDAGLVLGKDGEERPSLREMRTAKPEMTDEQRRRAGLATAKQAAVLKRAGANPWMKRSLANEAMAILSSNGWRWPGDSVPAKFR